MIQTNTAWQHATILDLILPQINAGSHVLVVGAGLGDVLSAMLFHCVWYGGVVGHVPYQIASRTGR